MSRRRSGCGIAGRSAWRPTCLRRRRREQRHNYHALRNRLNGLGSPSSVQSEAAVAPPAHEAAAANGPASEPALEPDAAANDNEPGGWTPFNGHRMAAQPRARTLAQHPELVSLCARILRARSMRNAWVSRKIGAPPDLARGPRSA